MRHNTSAFADSPQAVRRWSLLRKVWCDAELPGELIEKLCRGDVESVLFGSVPLQVKDRCIVAQCEIGSHSLLIKRHTWGGVSRTLRMAFREAAANSCARVGVYLHNLGVPIPRPRAMVDFRFGPWTYCSYLLSDYVEGTSLYRYIRRGSQSESELRHLAGQVAQIWQRLVELGVSHNDFKPENLIVDDQLKVWLIDLEKVRIRGKADRQRQRQIFDVKNFLHIRGWHRRSEARAIFAEAFLQMPHGNQLTATGVDRVAKGLSLHEAEKDEELSVLIVCDGGIKMPLVSLAIDSVQDIADEIVLVTPAAEHRLDVLKRIDVCEQAPLASASKNSPEKLDPMPLLRSDWVLALHQNECVTPFLTKELQQKLANARDNVAIRVPIERQYFGRSMARSDSDSSIRLFRQPECTYATSGGDIVVTAGIGSVGRLTGTIQANECATVSEFVERLNDASSDLAARRRDAGERPRLIRAGWKAACRLVVASLRKSGIRSGWTGMHVAALEAAFTWVEEVKLHQLAGEFHRENSGANITVSADAKTSDGRDSAAQAPANAA